VVQQPHTLAANKRRANGEMCHEAIWKRASLYVNRAVHCDWGCEERGSTTPPPVTTYVLTVNSTTPSSGVAISVSLADNNLATNGATSFTRTYNSGAAVVLTAPATAAGNNFASWSGCTSTTAVTCTSPSPPTPLLRPTTPRRPPLLAHGQFRHSQHRRRHHRHSR